MKMTIVEDRIVVTPLIIDGIGMDCVIEVLVDARKQEQQKVEIQMKVDSAEDSQLGRIQTRI